MLRLGLLLLPLPVYVCAAQQPRQSNPLSARIVRELNGGTSPFFRISGLASTGTGLIFVAEREDNRVRVFRADGSELRPLVTEGSGPREVRSPCCLAVTEDGFVVIRDNGNARFVIVRVTGGRDSTFVLRQHSPAGNAEIPTFTRGGTFADAFWRSWDPRRSPGDYRLAWSSTAGVSASDISVALPTWDSTTVYSTSRSSGGGSGQRFAYPRYGRQTLRSVSPNGNYAIAQSDRYVVQLHAANGRLIKRIERRDLPPIPLSEIERDSSALQIRWDARRLGVPERAIPWSAQRTKPPLRHLEFDNAGNLWIERAVALGTENAADIYDASGTFVQSVRWPANVRLRGFPRSLVGAIGLRVDDDGEAVVVLVFQ